ncbi:hypothetical protein HAX54_027378 [Datura stramonium]|uniref:Uncharacterized protein n=1 Tax=Datura stramonium TaxID=4076 RepID=A0ABS8S8R0_DATST|nr:hypothetical protein [Datura stramonium]
MTTLDASAGDAPISRCLLVLQHQGINEPLPVAVHISIPEFSLWGIRKPQYLIDRGDTDIEVYPPNINDRVREGPVQRREFNGTIWEHLNHHIWPHPSTLQFSWIKMESRVKQQD